ncbi:concanavalin A-like lectin/glucanase, partial [Violaceomyces palustris]
LTDEWVREIGGHGWGNEEIQDYTDFDRNSFLSSDPSLGEGEDGGGGQLVIRAEVDHSTSTFTSARLISRQTLSLNRGYLRVVLTPPIAKGIWPAFWLLPSKPFTWPQEGEVDVFETWNADGINRSCLHWGHHHLEEDRGKHVVRDGHENSDSESTTRSFGFAWFQREDQDVGGGPGEERKQPSKGGELIWYVDDKAVMKSGIPSGLRDLKDWNMIVNLAMAGNVMGGQRPDDGTYLLILHSLEIYRHPPGGWDAFRKDF